MGVGKLKRDLGWLKKEDGEGGICDGSGENGKVERMRGFNIGMRREMEFVQENREKKEKQGRRTNETRQKKETRKEMKRKVKRDFC